MIIRSWLILGTLIVVGAWVLTVPLSPPPYQASPGSFASTYRAEKLLPELGDFKVSTAVDHEVFEVPEADAEHLAAAAAASGTEKPGTTTNDPSAMPGMTAPTPGMDTGSQMAEQAAPMPGMNMGETATSETAAMDQSTMPGMTAPAPAMDMGSQMVEQAAPAPMPGMAMGGAEAEEGHAGGFGIAILPSTGMAGMAGMTGMAARTVEVEMGEWGFKPARVEVKPGEVIRFVVRNAGNLPHEFMFMPATAMQAMSYRLQRADWNLTEHEAIFEQAVVLPSESFEVTLRIEEAGSWMFMCMLPYHMQFGMMGMMMSEGVAVPAMDMGGMKM